jgi:F0F1-type ATP synthase epsilon subunit
MDLTIVCPLEHKTLSITWLEINTAVGNFVIQPGHVPTIMTLTPGEKVTFCLSNGKRESMLIKHGIVHITRTSATLILNET